MEWEKASTKAGHVVIPNKWVLLHYYDAMNVLFRIENALRMLVYVVLKNDQKARWVDTSLSTDDGSTITIGALAKQRISQQQSFGYLGFPISSPIMHLTSGELVRLLVSDAYWPHFAKYFRASKQVVTLKLNEIGTLRNSLAHFRPIKEDDVEVAKQNAQQMLTNVEAMLQEMLSCRHRVPSNSTEPWYAELRTLGGQRCRVTFENSENGDWVRISVGYESPVLNKHLSSTMTYARFRLLTLNPPAIIRRFEIIRGHSTCVTESVISSMSASNDVSFAKKVRFTFSRAVLNEFTVEIKGALVELIETIDSESDLIMEDNLATGEIVQAVTTSARKREAEDYSFWSFDESKIAFPVSSDHPPEYWGEMSGQVGDFISDTDSYPWMPVRISSNDDLPF